MVVEGQRTGRKKSSRPQAGWRDEGERQSAMRDVGMLVGAFAANNFGSPQHGSRVVLVQSCWWSGWRVRFSLPELTLFGVVAGRWGRRCASASAASASSPAFALRLMDDSVFSALFYLIEHLVIGSSSLVRVVFIPLVP